MIAEINFLPCVHVDYGKKILKQNYHKTKRQIVTEHVITMNFDQVQAV